MTSMGIGMTVNSYEAESHGFVKSIVDDTPEPAPAEQALMVPRILDAICESAESGKEVGCD
jgi:predicted dehydrogenase